MSLIAKDLETLESFEFLEKMLKHPLRKAHAEQLNDVLIYLLKKYTYSSGEHIGKLTPGGKAILSGFEGSAKGDSAHIKGWKESMLDQLKQEVLPGILMNMPSIELGLAETDFNEYEYVGYQERDGKPFILAVRLTDIVITYEAVLGFLKAKIKTQVQNFNAVEIREQQEREQQDKESAELLQELGLEDEALKNDSNNTDPPKKDINILPAYINPLFDFLLPYFDKSQHADLNRALSGESIKGLLFEGQSTQFADIFWYATGPDIKAITNTRLQVEKWICRTFLYRNKKGQVTPFNESNVHHSISTNSQDCQNPLPHRERLFK